METVERLSIRDGAPPQQSDGSVGCVMLHVSGSDDETRWFEYKAGYFAPITRIEWEHDTMSVVLPADMAQALISKGYARHMKASEARAYNAELEKETKQKETEK